MRFTLRTKLILLTTLLVTVIMAESTYFYTIREMNTRRAAVWDQIGRLARNIATIKLLDQQGWSVYQDYISQLMLVNDDIVYIAIYDDRLSLRAHTLNFDLIDINMEKTSTLSKTAQGSIVRRLDRGLIAPESQKDFSTQQVNIQVGDKVLGRVHVGFSLIKINDEIRNSISLNIIMALVFITIFSIIAALLSRRLTLPLERLSGAMSAIVVGDLDQEVVVENRDEIGKLAATFNDMVKGLRERSIIEDMGRQLSFTFQLDRLIDLVQTKLGGAIGARDAKLFLKKQKEDLCYIEPLAIEKDRNFINSIIFDQQAETFFSQNDEGFLINSAPQNVQNKMFLLELNMSELIIPMFVKGKIFGFISFSRHEDSPEFDDKQRHFASILANQAALALENATLYDGLREQERLKRELEIARDIQKNLLPATMPSVNGFQLDGVCIPADEVGGDYFDIFQIDQNRTGIAIADVSGKGTSASFYMAEIKGMMSILAPVYSSPKSLLIELNKKLFGKRDRKVFATMIYGIIDHKAKTFVFARAGHNSLLVDRGNEGYEVLTPAGLGLGLTCEEKFNQQLEEKKIKLGPGDTVLLYTDGITEAMNKQKDMFGEDRLIKVFSSNSRFDPVSLRDSILKSVEEFAAGAKQHDDLTMVVCRCNE